nr:DUF86 domain-containing protein [Bacteroidota bacterium]
MHDTIINERLHNILESISLIEERMLDITNPSDFRSTKEGLKTLDSIAMRLQHIAENIKKIDGLQPDFFETKIIMDPQPIINFRDFISHHYERTDVEIIYDICLNDIQELKVKINNYWKFS